MIAQEIKDIIVSFEQSKKDYKAAFDKVGQCDKETNDILHALELNNPKRNERNRMATRLRNIRLERRENKNIVEINEPLVLFLESERGANMMNLLKEVLGKTRKIEEYHNNRTYYPRLTKQTKGA